MKRPKAPCLGCDTRYESCHSDCERYLEFKEKLIEWKRYLSEQRLDDNEQDALEKNRIKRAVAYMRRSTGKK